MNIKSYPLKRGQWFEEATEKKYVVWHGTAGRTLHTPSSGRPGRMRRPPPVKPAAHARRSTAGTSAPSASARRICVRRSGAPSVSRDGTIYNTFDDTAWIYHLGIKGTNGRYDKSSVAIEFANELGLALDGDRLYAFGMNTPSTVYTGPFFAFDWRDYSYFAQLDEAQVDAGIELTLDICRRHDIEPSFYYPSTTFDFPRCFQVATIVCHSNCRRDKADLALPDWVYEKVEGAGIRLVS